MKKKKDLIKEKIPSIAIYVRINILIKIHYDVHINCMMLIDC